MTELGLDIDEEILLRVEPDYLIQCKSACKSWYSLISSHRFLKSHRKRHPGDTRIIVSSDANRNVNNCLKRSHSNERITVSNLQREFVLAGSSNGLVCLVCISAHYTDFLVVNPYTLEVKELADIDPEDWDGINVFAAGFGYDSSIDDFKVVVGHRSYPNDGLGFKVLELKTNIWRSVDVGWEEDYDALEGDGILCNGAIHWLYPNDCEGNYKPEVIVSFDLSTEVFKKIPLPKVDVRWNLGTIKNCLCVFRFSNINLEEIEMWVMRDEQVSWEPTLPPPGYDANKTTTLDYTPNINLLSGHVHIWLKEEGPGAPVLVRSIDHPIHPKQQFRRSDHEHIRLSTYSECNYNYDKHVFVKSLVSPHGGRAKIKRQSLVSSDYNGNGRRVEGKRTERERESLVFHSSDGRRANSKRQSHVSSDYNGNGRRVERKRRERESLVFHGSNGGRAKSKSLRHVSSGSHGDGRRVERKKREREWESLVFHGSDGGRANGKRQSHVSFDYNGNGRRVERKRRERESLVFHGSNGGRAKSKRQRHVSYDYDGDGRRVERKWRERERERERESRVFHRSDKGRAKSKSQIWKESGGEEGDDNGNEGRHKRKRKELIEYH